MTSVTSREAGDTIRNIRPLMADTTTCVYTARWPGRRCWWHRWTNLRDYGAWRYIECSRCGARRARQIYRNVHGPVEFGWLLHDIDWATHEAQQRATIEAFVRRERDRIRRTKEPYS